MLLAATFSRGLVGRNTRRPIVASSSILFSHGTWNLTPNHPQKQLQQHYYNHQYYHTTTMCPKEDGVTGAFDGKQFEKTEVADKVVEQYDEKQARVFYKYVMVRPVVLLYSLLYFVVWLVAYTHYYLSFIHILSNIIICRAAAALTFTMAVT